MVENKQYDFWGKHARFVKELKEKCYDGESCLFFTATYDIYIIAPLIGYMYQRKANRDQSSSDKTAIFAEQMNAQALRIKYTRQIIVLLDTNFEPDKEKRVDLAFNNRENTEVDRLYEQYLLGGIEVLHEKLLDKNKSCEENLYDFMEEINDINNGLSGEDITKLCATLVQKEVRY